MITRKWEAEDDCGNKVSASQVITVIDNEILKFSGVPGDLTVNCDNIPAPPLVTASDNCDPTLDIKFTEDNKVVEGCGTITRTWETGDNCGNKVKAIQVITVVDNAPPTLA